MLVFISNMKLDYFKRVYSILDLGYVIMNILIFTSMSLRHSKDMDEEEFRQSVQIERILEVIAILTLYSKATYFLSLVD